MRFLPQRKYGPIGVDIGSRGVKLVQFDADQKRLVEAARWDLPSDFDCLLPDEQASQIAAAIRAARMGRKFHGRDCVVSVGGEGLFIQNVRVAKGSDGDLERAIFQEAAGRIPFPVAEAEIRYIDAADVRQGDTVRREVIVLAVHQPDLDSRLQAVVDAGLRPIAVDAEPVALVRCYFRQFRRDEDRHQRNMFVHVGTSQTVVVIAEGADVLFVKTLDVGGAQMDAALAKNLNLQMADAAALRRHNGDRRAEQRDPEVTRSIHEAVRPVTDHLANELGLCTRYHSVTFRGQPLARVIVGGGEATPSLSEALAASLDVGCELGDPLRTYETAANLGRRTQWDVATGLALRSEA